MPRTMASTHASSPPLRRGPAPPRRSAASRCRCPASPTYGLTDSVVTPASAYARIRSAIRSFGPSRDVRSMNSSGTAAAASRCRLARYRSCTSRAASRTPSGRPGRCRSSSPGCPCRRRRAPRTSAPARRTSPTSSPTTTGTVGTTSKPVQRQADLGPAGGDRGELLGRELRARRRWPATRRRSRRPARGSSARPRRGRSGCASRGGWKLEPQRLARPVRQRQRVVLARRTRPSRGPAPSLTMSTYSRVRASGLSKRTPCQPSETCGPETPRPSRNRPPESVSMVAAVIAVVAGRAGRDLHDRRADVDPLGLPGDPGQDAGRVGAVRLGRPHHREAEPVGLLGQREVVGRRASTPSGSRG